MGSELRLPAPRGVVTRAVLGHHPRDGRPVACWLVHPVAPEPHALRILDDLASRLGLTSTTSAAFAPIAAGRAWTSADGEDVRLWSSGRLELALPADEPWRLALAVRGWTLVLVVFADLGDASHAAVTEYLVDGGRALAGIVHHL